MAAQLFSTKAGAGTFYGQAEYYMSSGLWWDGSYYRQNVLMHWRYYHGNPNYSGVYGATNMSHASTYWCHQFWADNNAHSYAGGSGNLTYSIARYAYSAWFHEQVQTMYMAASSRQKQIGMGISVSTYTADRNFSGDLWGVYTDWIGDATLGLSLGTVYTTSVDLYPTVGSNGLSFWSPVARNGGTDLKGLSQNAWNNVGGLSPNTAYTLNVVLRGRDGSNIAQNNVSFRTPANNVIVKSLDVTDVKTTSVVLKSEPSAYKDANNSHLVVYGPSDTVVKGDTIIRYLRIYQNGSTANTGNHICFIKVTDRNFNGNLAKNRPLTGHKADGTSLAMTNALNATNKDSVSNTYAEYPGGNGVSYFQLDLGADYSVGDITVIRYYPDSRTYYNTAVKGFKSDGTQTLVLHDSDVHGTYMEREDRSVMPETMKVVENLLPETNYRVHNWYGTIGGAQSASSFKDFTTLADKWMNLIKSDGTSGRCKVYLIKSNNNIYEIQKGKVKPIPKTGG